MDCHENTWGLHCSWELYEEKAGKKLIWIQLNASTFKAEHIIHLDELTCGKPRREWARFHVKICQSTNISKNDLILKDIDFSQLNGK